MFKYYIGDRFKKTGFYHVSLINNRFLTIIHRDELKAYYVSELFYRDWLIDE